jgi:4-carboxymuconolactone decarboxylase
VDDRERFAQGRAIRRAVLGEAHVDRAEAARGPLSEAFQDLITRYAWGEVWARPGLPRHTRSLLTLAMLVALNRPAELRLHLRAAAACGVTQGELRELLLHAAVYCGVPAAHAALLLAEEELSGPPSPGDPP